MTASPIGLSFAQNYEDVLLWRALGHVKDGCYLDIGACDPVVDSVSRAFYLAGWRGVHVDASATYAEALRQERPDETVVHAAVGDTDGFLTFYEFPETGLSTCVAEFAERHRQAGRVCKVSTVPVISLKELLNLAAKPEIHWLKIDVEGLEGSVLRSWGDSTVRPWVLVIESTEPNSQVPTQREWVDMVHQLGYHEVAFDGLSRFFVSNSHPELDEAFVASPNVFDDFHVTENHFSTRTLVSQWQAERESLLGQVGTLGNTLDEFNAELAELRSELEARNHRIQTASQIINDTAKLLASSRVLAIKPKTRRLLKRVRCELQNWSVSEACGPAPVCNSIPEPSVCNGSKQQSICMSISASKERDPNTRADSLADLCAFADLDFVHCAFVTLLGRQPDPLGEAYYLTRLRAGVSKLSILRHIRMSEEGRNCDPGIGGFDRAMRRHRNANLPVIGRFVRWLTGGEGETALERRLRVIENQQRVEAISANSRFLHSNRQLQDLVEEVSALRRVVTRISEAGGSSPNLDRQIAEADDDWASTITKSLKS